MSVPISFLPSLDRPNDVHASPVLALRISPNYIVTGSADTFVRVWLKSSGNLALPALSGEPKASFKTVEISEQLGLVFGGDGKGNITVWRLSDGEILLVQSAHKDTVLSLALDKSTLISTSRDQVAKVWELETTDGLHLTRLQLSHTLQRHRMAVLAAKTANNRIYTSSGDRSIRIWDKHSGNLIRKLEGVASITCFQLRKNAAGTEQLVGACTDGTVRIYNTETGAELACLEGHTNVVSSVQLLKENSVGDGTTHVASASYDGGVRLWKLPEGDLSSGKCVTQLSFTDAVVTPLSLPVPLKANNDPVDPAREEERQRRDLERQGERLVRRAFAMQVSDGYLYCGGESAHVVAWNLHSDLEYRTTWR
jgi:WD40 repeat protein